MDIPQSETVMHEDVLLAVLVEIREPGMFLVVGQDDRQLLRPPGLRREPQLSYVGV
jgi:hypothetical protein